MTSWVVPPKQQTTKNTKLLKYSLLILWSKKHGPMCRAKIVYPACLWNLDSKNEINIETKLVLPVLDTQRL